MNGWGFRINVELLMRSFHLKQFRDAGLKEHSRLMTETQSEEAKERERARME